MEIIFNGKKNVLYYIKIKRLPNRTIDYIYIYHSNDFSVEDSLVGTNTIDISITSEMPYLNMILTKAIVIKESKTCTKLEGFICEENGSYITACSLRNYRQFQFIDSENKILDGSKINSENELYIRLGEIFYGIGGFFGVGLDGLYDYLIDVGKNNSLDKITLLIINKENLISKLKEGYYSHFVKMLKDKKLSIVEK